MYHPQRAPPPQNQSSSIPAFNLDDDNLEPLWASASQPSQFMERPSESVEDDSPVEEEEVTLCKAWLSTSEDGIKGNGKKALGFWKEVTRYFYKEIGEQKRSYDLVNCKWKNKIRPKILKDHSKWKKVEMPKFYKFKKSSSKKLRTSETTSQGNSDSAHIGLNLNGEPADLEDVDVQEVAPMGRDWAKKKASSSGACSKTSIASDPSLVDELLSKFTTAATPFFSQRKESSSEYLRIKERELELED
ncbi:hypothetical protein Tco_1044341 [Tanacetum coccineum]|uniref:Myb-like domain-containing protein n=1 Tax=Tanacetum coccineum TaxID=301880 RepID=A0ABQ5GPN2_9ASTR